MSNKNLNTAKKAKNDEFYTQLADIEKELIHYKQHFKDKIVYCNCDDPTYSAFWRYFHLNFHELGLKKLISTHYDKENPTYKMEYDGTYDKDLSPQDIDNDINIGIKTPLQGNGDFRNQECIELLKECDIVCTNPPFSLWREYIKQLMDYGKHFLIIGNINVQVSKEVFPLIKNNKIWSGYNGVSEFMTPSGAMQYFGNICWFTNLDIPKRHEDFILWRNYYDNKGNPVSDTKSYWLSYENYDAINVDKMKDIPIDYEGIMGVPISILSLYNLDQFEIISCGEPAILVSDLKKYKQNFKEYKSRQIMVNNQLCQKTYLRIFVRNKRVQKEEKKEGKKE